MRKWCRKKIKSNNNNNRSDQKKKKRKNNANVRAILIGKHWATDNTIHTVIGCRVLFKLSIELEWMNECSLLEKYDHSLTTACYYHMTLRLFIEKKNCVESLNTHTHTYQSVEWKSKRTCSEWQKKTTTTNLTLITIIHRNSVIYLEHVLSSAVAAAAPASITLNEHLHRLISIGHTSGKKKRENFFLLYSWFKGACTAHLQCAAWKTQRKEHSLFSASGRIQYTKRIDSVLVSIYCFFLFSHSFRIFNVLESCWL